jgi:hypothetical protein
MVVLGHLRWRQFLPALSLLLGLTIGCAQSRSESLPDRMQPGVQTGVGSLDKRLLASVDGIGSVTDIQHGELRSRGKVELGIAGNYGARFFDEAGRPTASVDFAVREPDGLTVSADIVSLSRAHAVRFFRHGYAAYASLVEADGKETWRTPYRPFTSTCGDLNGDGTQEFIFARTPDAVIEARNGSGVIIWQTQPGHTVFKLAVISTDGGEGSKLLAVESGALLGFGPHGERLFERTPPIGGYFHAFSPVRWPSVCTGECLLVSTNDKIRLLTPDGEKEVTKLTAGYIYQPRGVAVRLDENERPLLAVAGELPYRGKNERFGGVLYVFDAHRSLVYHEVFPEPVEALGVMPAADDKSEILLVGDANKVWQYTMPPGNTSHSVQAPY